MLRADLYGALAEVLAEPPEWMAAPGREWPLFEIAAGLGPTSEAARRAVEALAEVRAESTEGRRARYTALFVGAGQPRFWLYESATLTGRILGPATFAVEKLYRAAGLDLVGAELPDHASLELAFLAHLAAIEQDATLLAERQFIEQHAGRWLPSLGRALAGSGDEAYAPIGQLLADWLTERAGASAASPVTHQVRSAPSPAIRLPAAPHPETCTLCGFCVQVCPVRALAIRESASETVLALNAAACVGCGKCKQICKTRALEMKQLPKELKLSGSWNVLRQSPRAMCRACGEPMVSRAELDFVAAQIGQPAWLDYCLECRPAILEMRR